MRVLMYSSSMISGAIASTVKRTRATGERPIDLSTDRKRVLSATDEACSIFCMALPL